MAVLEIHSGKTLVKSLPWEGTSADQEALMWAMLDAAEQGFTITHLVIDDSASVTDVTSQ